MAETENQKVSKKEPEAVTEPKAKKRRFSVLVAMASILSLGSLIWTTYSLLDFFQDGGIDPATFNWKDVSIIGLSAAATADIAWSLTMFAQYRGTRIMVRKKWGEKPFEVDILPAIGWIEVLFVAALLFFHGRSVGGGEASFAAVLPILTKFSWMVALADLKDPAELTDEEKAEIAEMERDARRTKAKIKATAELHEAEMEQKRRQNEAMLEDKKLQNQLTLLDKATDYEMQELKLRQENQIQVLGIELKADLRMKEIDARNRIDEKREEHDWLMGLRSPRVISGHVVPRRGLSGSTTLEITDGVYDPDEVEVPDLAALGLTGPEQKRAELARSYYATNAMHNGTVTKAAFAKANDIGAPRVTEATKAFPIEWFVERNLATWLERQS